ncbi:MAG: calcium-binding protein [Paracoccaceae bacterium]|nr:calcium-binding protein [Paracoccaceae bacterium]
MLGLLGLMGILIGGVAADALMSSGEAPDDSGSDDDANAESAQAQGEGAPGDMMDWAGVEPGPAEEGIVEPVDQNDNSYSVAAPYSDDVPNLIDPGQVLAGGQNADTLTGDGGDDTIVGNAGDDQLGGRSGDDRIEGGAGRDYVNAGAGDDTVLGGMDDDTLHGEDGDDQLFGGDGDDALYGHNGADLLSGDAGDDSLLGGSGNDTLIGGAGDDWLHGGYDDDLLVGGEGSDTLDGDFGNDTLVGHAPGTADAEVDFLNGGAGDDLLVVGNGDYATGNEGADTFALGDWLTEGDFADIQDYDAVEDEIVVVYDPTTHPDPQLTLQEDDETDDVTLLLDGLPLAVVHGGAGLDIGSIRLTTAMPY